MRIAAAAVQRCDQRAQAILAFQHTAVYCAPWVSGRVKCRRGRVSVVAPDDTFDVSMPRLPAMRPRALVS